MAHKRLFRSILFFYVLLNMLSFVYVPLKGVAIKAGGNHEIMSEHNDTVRKVINAMLSMQRRAWEQGVASQALLELGENELVILLAKDAVVNQKKD